MIIKDQKIEPEQSHHMSLKEKEEEKFLEKL